MGVVVGRSVGGEDGRDDDWDGAREFGTVPEGVIATGENVGYVILLSTTLVTVKFVHC